MEAVLEFLAQSSVDGDKVMVVVLVDGRHFLLSPCRGIEKGSVVERRKTKEQYRGTAFLYLTKLG